ncbi:hypothetical protein EJ04DRAFT_523323 [Polyplosphaeria fusca]|uniref:Uncharacterized protein n=1 Tax=Polyplosphaeria fusca TaxID=682080 RepID=A0A9P4V3W9_9PLEO|nr:hypothetical protein EJ04DRAFT_523323 [Polyplosphaeria fusca]
MPLFSRMRKAKKAAEDHKQAKKAAKDHKKTTKVVEDHRKTPVQSKEPRPPPVPYKHIPTHAAQDALSATPARSPEESRALIAAARKRRDEMIAALPVTAIHPSANIERRLPARPVYRTKSDLSIDSVMQSHIPESPRSVLSTERQSVGRRPLHRLDAKSLENPYSFSQPRDAPSPPPRRSSYSGTIRPSITTARKNSPLPPLPADDESVDSSSSQKSTDTRTSSQASSVNTKRSRSSLGSGKLLMLSYASQKHEPIVEISLPYASDDQATIVPHRTPTWRYEDFGARRSGTSASATPSRRSSILSFFHRG